MIEFPLPPEEPRARKPKTDDWHWWSAILVIWFGSLGAILAGVVLLRLAVYVYRNPIWLVLVAAVSVGALLNANHYNE